MRAPRSASARLAVHTDASWSDGVAAVAMAGHVPARCEVLQLPSSTIAEAEALLFAMTVLASRDVYRGRPVIFRTDHQALVEMLHDRARVRGRQLVERITEIRAHLADRRHWRVQHAHRSVVHDAHALARRALHAHLHLQQGAA